MNEGCVCGHGQYNHGGGYRFIGRLFGEHSRCIRCECVEFRRSSGVGSARPSGAVEAERRQDQAEPCNTAPPTKTERAAYGQTRGDAE